MAESTADGSRRLYLIDGTAYAFRAYHAGMGLTAPDGTPTDAIYGVTSMLWRLLHQDPPSHLAIAFDMGGSSHREKLLEQYKAHRAPTPEDLPGQIDAVRKIASAMGIQVVELPDYEADDIIATLATRAADAGYEVLVFTGDKDMLQLVGARIRVRSEHRDNVVDYDADAVVERWGVRPEQIADILALVGDTADNIPGVPGVGKKTAPQMLAEHPTIQDLVSHIDDLPDKWAKLLRDHGETALLSRELATLFRDLELPWSPDDCAIGEPDATQLRDLFRRYGFRSLLDDLESESPRAEAPETDTRIITDEPSLQALVEMLSGLDAFAVDLETTSLRTLDAEIVGISLSWEAGKGVYIPVGHSYLGVPAQLPRDKVLEALRPVLADPRHGKVGHHLKYDLAVFANAGVSVEGIRFDSLLASYLLNTAAPSFKLDDLSMAYLKRPMIPITQLIGERPHQRSFSEVDVEHASKYAAEDADVSWQLYEVMSPEVEKAGLTHVLRDIECPLVPVLERMERNGVRVDLDCLKRLSQEFQERLEETEERIYEIAGERFNIGSPKKLAYILFEKLGLPPGRKTKTGYSTDVRVLEDLAAEHDLPDLILRHRSFAKLKGTYVDSLPSAVRKDTGRIHTSYHQAVAATGRIQSNDPNLQNIPVRTDEGREIRRAFVPEEGWRMLVADYSQIELRILAHLSGDEALTQAFHEDRDVHAHTASLVFGVPLNEVTDDQRRQAKMVNFGVLYGMGAFGLATRLHKPRGEAQEFIDRYFATYPMVRGFFDGVVEKAEKDGFVTTITGRRRLIPELAQSNRQVRDFGRRAAMNAPIQGAAADIIKVAMIRLDAFLRESGMRSRMLLQVHDELVFESPPDEVDALHASVVDKMESAFELAVPLRVDVGVGDNWLDAK